MSGEARRAAALGIICLAVSACGEKDAPQDEGDGCAIPLVEASAGAKGQGFVFDPDPMASADDPSLSPLSVRLDDYRAEVTLRNLGGRGVLEGRYVDVRNGLACSERFGVFSENNRFLYSHADSGFQEAMSYYFGDRYRSYLDGIGGVGTNDHVTIVAHCMEGDNAYFVRGLDLIEGLVRIVCLGNSVETPGASYADDASVLIHELQHSTTVDAYSLTQELNRFWFDEAGALNEAVSDFMALAYVEPTIPTQLDPRVFSRWALGTFVQNHVATRGAHFCPEYDSQHPDCAGYANGAAGFSAASNRVSYSYPDGVGWPYANNFGGGLLRTVFEDYPSQEEIHNTGVVVVGALWDAFQAVKANHGGDSATASSLTGQAVLRALGRLPKPSSSSRSPVTFRGFSSEVVAAAADLGFSAADRDAIEDALENRGLTGGASLAPGWAGAGPGDGPNPGLRIVDNPNTLKGWVSSFGGDPAVVTQGLSTGTNGRLDPGEVVALWLDVSNSSALTAGGLLVTVKSLDPDVTFLDARYNDGAVSEDSAQIMYFKVNGSDVVAALGDDAGAPGNNVPAGSTYFLTNPFYSRRPTTALWVRAEAGADSGDTVTLRATIRPSNGSTETVDFPLTIN